jgi:RNA-directed DNA polymerase
MVNLPMKEVVPVVQKFDYPKSESELRSILDRLYGLSRKSIEEGNTPVFKGLLKVISAEATILTAIHNIKANRGSETHGSDRKTIRHFLENDYESVIEEVKNMFQNYKPLPVRRVYIPKPGKSEKRPLGIPAIADRIVQECIRIVLDPIAEAHFFSHSYGFRPMRESRMALQRITNIVHSTGYHWVVEGDIKKFFDNVNYSILIKQLWHLGIRDRRILMIIKTMLKAGVMKECTTSDLGTPQGGIISPLLANIYLNTLDQWVTREWENKKTRHHYPKQDVRIRMLRKNSKLKPAYFVRYADDWVLITNSKSNAEKWKSRISDYLKTNLKLELSEDKTLITNITKKAVKFLGVHIKFKSGKARKGWIPSTRPNPDRLSTKVKEIYKSIRNLKRFHPRDKLEFIHQINVINSKIRGLIEYYQPCTRVNVELAKYSFNLRRTAFNVLNGKLGAQWACK